MYSLFSSKVQQYLFIATLLGNFKTLTLNNAKAETIR